MNVLVVNTGSSSLKFQLFNMKDETWLARGICERIGSKEAFMVYEKNGAEDEIKTSIVASNHDEAFKYVFESLVDKSNGAINDLSEIGAIGHRVVHAGEKFAASVLIDDSVVAALNDCVELAPLHNPPNITGIKACRSLMPDVPMVGVFDTAFHQTIPKEAFMYGLPYELYEKYGVRRYGFHGTSHRYVSAKAAELLGKRLEEVSLVTCHLGNGSSISAIKNGKSVDTSMGFTPLEGLVMGTRSGDIDPAIIGFISEKLNMTANEVCLDYLNKKSGVLGLSGGISNDFRNLTEAAKEGNELAALAIDVFVYRIVKYIGSYAAAMGSLDGIVLTAGIGENSVDIRKMICNRLGMFGVVLDQEKNAIRRKELVITKTDSKVPVMVVPTNEELVIARDTYEIVLSN